MLGAVAAAALALGAGLFLMLRDTAPGSSARTPVRFTNPPYLGMSCRGGGVACGRFGVAVWLTTPADSVEATVLGQHVALATAHAANDSSPYGYGRFWTGFVRVADLNYTHAIPVRLRVVVRRGDASGITTRHVMLREGWG